MRKLFLMMLTLALLLLATVAQAAQVTDAKWGVNKDNVLRLVLDVTDSAGYAVSLRGNNIYLTVNADLGASVPRTRKVYSSLADTMYVKSDRRATVLQVPLKKTIKSSDYKVFLLQADSKTHRPFRVVLDINADKRAANAVSTTPRRSTVGTKPTKPTKSTKTKKDVSKATSKIKNNTKQKQTSTTTNYRWKTTAVPADSRTMVGRYPVIKATKPYRTSGGLDGKIITIDAGHGGTDSGAIGLKGTYEKNVTMPIAMNLKKELENRGATVYMTRTTDIDVSDEDGTDAEELQARVNVAEQHNSDAFISVHINSCATRTVGGIASYYYEKSSFDEKLASCIQKQLAANFGVENRGVQEANFYVMKRSTMPTTLLELGFISNPKEEAMMITPWFQTKVAKVIADGVENYFG